MFSVLSSLLMLFMSSLSFADSLDVSAAASKIQAQIDESTSVAADKNCQSAAIIPSSGGNLVSVSGGVDLIHSYSWQRMEGAVVDGENLCISDIDRKIVGMPIDKNGVGTSDWLPGHPHEPDTADPPINFFGPHIETKGDFAVTANFNAASSGGGLITLYGRVPVIQDEARREGEAVAFGLVEGKVLVKIWDGKSADPKSYSFAQGVKMAKLSIEKSEGSFLIKQDDKLLGKLPDPGVFKSGVAYIGANIEKKSKLCLSNFTVSEPQSESGHTRVLFTNPIQEITPSPTGLRSLAINSGLNVGTCVSVNALLTDSDYRARLAQNFNMVTPENATKFQFIHPSKDHYAFDDADAIVDFANANHMKLHAHTLVWGEANPRWIIDGKYSNEQLRKILHDHIMTVVGHFKGKVAEWDVLNEPLEDDGSLRQTIWAKALGSDYPAIVFKWAHEADPEAKLFINEYGADGVSTLDGKTNIRAEALAKLVEAIRAKGAPVDGVGLQMHDELNDSTSRQSISQNMERFQRLGIDTRISEMDVNMPDSNPANEAKQAQIYRDALAACLENRNNCHTFSMWGFEDKYSSLQDNEEMYSPTEGLGDGMVYDQNAKPRPAYTALQQELSE